MTVRQLLYSIRGDLKPRFGAPIAPVDEAMAFTFELYSARHNLEVEVFMPSAADG
jgi:hypothetical protein